MFMKVGGGWVDGQATRQPSLYARAAAAPSPPPAHPLSWPPPHPTPHLHTRAPPQIPGWNDEPPMRGGETTGETLAGFGDLHGHAAKDAETLEEIKDDSVHATVAATEEAKV